MNCYTVLKQTSTHADTLAAIGAADMLRHLDPRIVELEDRFEIHWRKPLTPGDLDVVDPGFSYLERPGRNSPSLVPERILQVRRESENGHCRIAAATLSENRMYSILARMKAFGGPNRVVSRFANISREEWTKSIWECMHGRRHFVFSFTLVQLFNPHSGKGYALLKPTGTSRGDKTKDRWADQFLEWLRFRVDFESSAGWFTAGDLRLFCPIPANLLYDRFAAAAASFRDLNLGGTAVKIDCRAVLGMARLLIEGEETYRSPRQC